jgi:hypothetical protein
MQSLRTPVLLITYKRIDTTIKVLESIAEVQPMKLYIASNAPNPQNENDAERVMQVRALFEEKIIWPCQVQKLYRTEHLSAKHSIWTAIKWFFENEEEGIVLEDDVFADKSFYYFCEELLNKYRNDQRIRFINGCNFGYKGLDEKDYGFTRFMNMWGWASWRRSIDIVDSDMNAWNFLPDKNKFLENVIDEQSANTKKIFVEYFRSLFDDITSLKIESWDYPCIFSNFLTKTFCVYPSRNVIKNLGFNNDGTHTNFDSYFISGLKVERLKLPLSENPDVLIDKTYEKFVLERWAHLKIRNRLYYSLQYRWFKLKKKLGAA